MCIRDRANTVLYMANVGDSKSVLCQDSTFKVLTTDHRPTNTKEADRIRDEGGQIMYDRVGGMLAVSRALGDHFLKTYGVSCVPDIKRVELRKIDKLLIIASDGLWDFVDTKSVYEVTKEMNLSTTAEIASELIKRAIGGCSKDNISILALRLF
eukprot:TRINITY_DN1692_c0_g1_i8.p3 TRINITY_DN1692_c0_g1~~TRINITY_DN1692_c0_g1_i8.p3  ORF type:complete len:154 (-),score=30.16 TRINITY_DN1692_c0_g1_i8:44-505(-)